MRGKKVSEELKARIIEESLKEGCVISELGKRYNLASETIYNWRSSYRKLNSSVKLKKDTVDSSSEFMELSVLETGGSNLQSASLKFDNFSVVMEGRIKSSALVSIISILEKTC